MNIAVMAPAGVQPPRTDIPSRASYPYQTREASTRAPATAQEIQHRCPCPLQPRRPACVSSRACSHSRCQACQPRPTVLGAARRHYTCAAYCTPSGYCATGGVSRTSMRRTSTTCSSHRGWSPPPTASSRWKSGSAPDRAGSARSQERPCWRAISMRAPCSTTAICRRSTRAMLRRRRSSSRHSPMASTPTSPRSASRADPRCPLNSGWLGFCRTPGGRRTA